MTIYAPTRGSLSLTERDNKEPRVLEASNTLPQNPETKHRIMDCYENPSQIVATLSTVTKPIQDNQSERFTYSDWGCEIDHRDPVWFKDIELKAREYLGLPTNWDTYGASRIDSTIVKVALYWLSGVCSSKTPKPYIVGTHIGGIQIEWHLVGKYFEVEFLTPSLVAFYYKDDYREIENEINFGDNTQLNDLVRNL